MTMVNMRSIIFVSCLNYNNFSPNSYDLVYPEEYNSCSRNT